MNQSCKSLQRAAHYRDKSPESKTILAEATTAPGSNQGHSQCPVSHGAMSNSPIVVLQPVPNRALQRCAWHWPMNKDGKICGATS